MKQRIFSAVIGLLLFAVVLFFFDGIIFNIAIAVVCVMAVYEILLATKYISNKLLSIVSLAFAGVVPFFKVIGFNHIAKLVVFLFIASLFAVLLYEHERTRFEQIGLIFFVAIVVPFAFTSIIYIRDFNPANGFFYVFLVFSCAWGSDTGAYFTGRFLGKHKLAPKISPNKTVEGAVGGVVASIIFGAAIAYIYTVYMQYFGVTVSINWVILGIVCAVMSVIGMFGDLSASIIKRQCAIKDFGSIMPGHGGVLDRFDSVLFIAPSLFILLQFIGFVS